MIWNITRSSVMIVLPVLDALPAGLILPNIICESPDENAIASLVAEDFGIALVADVAILDHFKLEKLHLSDVTLHHTVYLAYLRGHYQIPAVRNFISFIKKEGTSL